jgi:hypothetical protein
LHFLYPELAEQEFLRKTEPSDKPYRVKSGKSIAERISELTGIHVDTVRGNLSEEYKGPQKAGVTPASLGKSEPMRVPKAIEPEVRAIVQTLEHAVAEQPEQVELIIAGCSSGLSQAMYARCLFRLNHSINFAAAFGDLDTR